MTRLTTLPSAKGRPERICEDRAGNCLMTRDHQFLEYKPETGITRERWDEYRRPFAGNDITLGIPVKVNGDSAGSRTVFR
jgi:hypothetical protein